MRFITTILALTSALAFTSAAPAPGESSVVRGNIFVRQALCMDHPCDFDTDCYAWRCGNCQSNGKCGCPPEANGPPC
ncbi:hypothetical protein P3342_008999 [Pyrenophora teres f. teres]|uniref:Uncharacterized protein n=1 Tax=Pyrenophora teres f. teres TaxID=97479 RepID=A0A6S6W6M2_9PLEO|nr:hypothetical protein HRS9122_10014 [Pyrenophora teres f. teres]KAK1919275.1 hypothetical protein P3342_008999 [Pyrenophora teres f. teres]CAE7188788.1 hypothetical protein PTTW11_07377 [Pyrenophora teres f. teres]